MPNCIMNYNVLCNKYLTTHICNFKFCKVSALQIRTIYTEIYLKCYDIFDLKLFDKIKLYTHFSNSTCVVGHMNLCIFTVTHLTLLILMYPRAKKQAWLLRELL